VTVRIDLTVNQARSLVRLLDHTGNEAATVGGPVYSIDSICRKEARARWQELRSIINNRIPKKHRIV